MDEQKLRDRVGSAQLVIGEIRDTIDNFISQYSPAPIGFVFNDTDYYSSTLASLKLFTYSLEHPECFMPRIFQYYDDIIGSHWEMYGDRNGQLAAINDFNRSQGDIFIHHNQNLLADIHRNWRHQIYYCHLLKHPRYMDYIGGSPQTRLEAALALK